MKMDLTNTTLDDISGVIGFSATLRISAWYGHGNNLFVPNVVEDGQVLVLLIGKDMAERLSAAFPGEHLAIPRISSYDEDMRRCRIAQLLQKGFSTREVSRLERMSERRVQQLCREMEQQGLIAPIGPAKTAPKKPREKAPGKNARKKP